MLFTPRHNVTLLLIVLPNTNGTPAHHIYKALGTVGKLDPMVEQVHSKTAFNSPCCHARSCFPRLVQVAGFGIATSSEWFPGVLIRWTCGGVAQGCVLGASLLFEVGPMGLAMFLVV